MPIVDVSCCFLTLYVFFLLFQDSLIDGFTESLRNSHSSVNKYQLLVYIEEKSGEEKIHFHLFITGERFAYCLKSHCRFNLKMFVFPHFYQLINCIAGFLNFCDLKSTKVVVCQVSFVASSKKDSSHVISAPSSSAKGLCLISSRSFIFHCQVRILIARFSTFLPTEEFPIRIAFAQHRLVSIKKL